MSGYGWNGGKNTRPCASCEFARAANPHMFLSVRPLAIITRVYGLLLIILAVFMHGGSFGKLRSCRLPDSPERKVFFRSL